MLLGFISLLLAIGQKRIIEIYISESLGNSFLQCPKDEALEEEDSSLEETEMSSIHRKLMFIASHATPLRQSLETDEVATGHCASKVEFFFLYIQIKWSYFYNGKKIK